jgi:hypothetical protein
MNYQIIKVERRSPHLGAFIDGVDMTQSLDDAVVTGIRAALLEFSVFFFEARRLAANNIWISPLASVSSMSHTRYSTMTRVIPDLPSSSQRDAHMIRNITGIPM